MTQSRVGDENSFVGEGFVGEDESGASVNTRQTQFLVEPSIEAGFNRKTQLLSEAMIEGGTNRKTQLLGELLLEGGKIRISQLLIELPYLEGLGTRMWAQIV